MAIPAVSPTACPLCHKGNWPLLSIQGFVDIGCATEQEKTHLEPATGWKVAWL